MLRWRGTQGSLGIKGQEYFLEMTASWSRAESEKGGDGELPGRIIQAERITYAKVWLAGEPPRRRGEHWNRDQDEAGQIQVSDAKGQISLLQ